MSLIPVLLTAVGFAVASARGLSDLATYGTVAAAVTVSALIGLLIAWRAKPTVADLGLGRPVGAAQVAWWLPLPLVIIVGVIGSGVVVSGASAAVFLWLAIVVGINEEIYFRGLALAILRRYGTQQAVIWSAVLFAVLHLTNLANGKSVSYALLQLAFSGLFGVVTAELVILTRSIWPGVVFHAAFDLVAYLGGDSQSRLALACLAVQALILAGYAVWLWRRLPTASDH